MVASLCFAALTSTAKADIQTWDRPVTDGVAFRMEIIPDQNLIIYGLRLRPDAVEVRPVLANGTIYDSTPANGRATLSQIVAMNKAQGGINADFFQFGDDPGGDPSGGMIFNRELISLPGTDGRADTFGWSDTNLFSHLDLKRRARIFLPGSGTPVPLTDINTRLDPNELILSTPIAKETYSKTPYLRISLTPPNPTLRPRTNKAACKVAKIDKIEGRQPIADDEWVLTVSPERQPELASLKVGDELRVDTAVNGFDNAETPYVIGGGPELISEGIVKEFDASNTFAQTKHPRSAVGKLPNGEVWYIVADGRQLQSGGATLPELAKLLKRWGCTEAFNLDGGGSSSINLFGSPLNRPSGGTERQIANAVVWKFPKAVFPMIYFDFALPESIPVGKPYQLDIKPPGSICTAQGAAWVDQEGTLHPFKEGECSVTVIAYGQARTHKLNVVP